MKVLQINSVCGYGSTGRIAVDLYSILEKKGHECVIAYGRGTAPNDIKSIKVGSKLNNYIHVACTRLADKHGFSSRKATVKFIEDIKEFNPDIIHLHNLHGYYINLKILFDYLSNAGKPIVWTLHDCWAFTGHCTCFDYIKCDKWIDGCFNCPQKKAYPKSLVRDNSRLNYKKKKKLFTSVKNMTIITPSDWLAGLVRQSFIKQYNVKVINNGIDLDTFTPTESDFRVRNKLENKIIVLGVASVWTQRKGLHFFERLSEDLGDNYAIVIVGVSEKIKKTLSKKVLGIARTNSLKDLAEIYTAADVFVNPTLEETLGLTNIEALACGTPVITFNTGGSPECIDETCGIIVEKDNYEALSLAIKSLGESRFTKEACMKKAKEFDKKDRYAQYLDIYTDNINQMSRGQ